MTRCYICEKSEINIPNSKVTYYGRKNGKKVQKTVRICNCCGAMIIPVRKPQTDKVARGPGTGESMAVGDYK